MSEPDSGSDLASIRTRAVAVTGGYEVTGAKVWTSYAHESHFAITLVRTAPAEAAKIRAGEAAGKVAEIAHQVHGAIGFTHEHSLHRLTRRLWSWRDEFGTESHWSRELGRAVLASGADALWPTITAE